VPAAPPSDRELDAYRNGADRFIAELDEEFYLHYAGLKDDFDLTSIYERHSDLTTLEKAQWIGSAVNGGSRVRELWRFSCEGYLGNLTRDAAERSARLEAELKATVDGEEIAYRNLRPAIANEDDRGRRQRLEEARNDLTEEHLNPLLLDAARTVQRETEKLGSPTYVDLYTRFGYRLDDLAAQCQAILDSTEKLFETWMDKLFRARVGVPFAEAERWDTSRVFRGQNWDTVFPAERMVPALEGTLSDLGVDLRSQRNVELDLEDRPNKSPRAFCAPIEVPDRVVLVIKPIGGPDDWRALFHEAGHTEHFAHTSADLAVEERRMGDNAVTEGWASLMEHLTDEPAWLNRMLDFPRPAEYAAEGSTTVLWLLRRYAAKLLYEIEFHGGADPETMATRYAEILGDALKVVPSPTDYLSDFDTGFYVTEYLRSWSFEAQMRGFLREKFGNAWFSSHDAGSLLRELWSEGQRMNADEMLREVTGASIEMESVAERVRERLT
jgi:hypothetical protein